MTRRLPLLVGAFAFAALAAPAAQAGRGHFGGGHFAGHVGGGHFAGHVRFGGAVRGGIHFGGVHFGGRHYAPRVHVGGYRIHAHWARPWRRYGRYHWGLHGHIWVGGYYNPYWYGYWYPQYVPSYYGTTYYPVAPAYSAASTAVVAAQPPLPRFGIGVFGGMVYSDLNNATNTSENDLGVLARFRITDGFLIEGDLGRTSYDVSGKSNVRVDRKLGGSLIYELGARNTLAPYALVGLGVQQANVSGSYSTTQDFAEIGAGLRYAFSPHFALTLDVRAGSRSTVSNDSTPPKGTLASNVTPPTSNSGNNENYTRVRLAGVLYF